MAEPRHTALPPGYELDQFRIAEVLGQGGFGITYRALDTRLERTVAIKEYLPRQFAWRGDDSTVLPREDGDREVFAWGLKRFIDEARALARFRHPNIVAVMQFLEANGTAYLVMEYEEGCNLEAWLMLHPEGMAEDVLIDRILLPLLDGLQKVHDKGLLHRDIKPENVFIRHDGTPVLIDFGASRPHGKDATVNLTSLISAGYSPFEQYGGAGRQGPWSDLYALAGTMYRVVTGQKPADALVRQQGEAIVPAVEAGRGRYSEAFLSAIDRALALDPAERPQTAAEFRGLLHRGAVRGDSDATYVRPGREVAKAGRRRGARASMLALAVAAIAGVAWWLWSDRLAETRPPAAAESQSAPLVAALPMRNLTGDGGLDWLGEGLANLVRDNLAQSRYLAVVSGSRTRQLQQTLADPAQPGGEIEAAGVDFLLSGEILKAPGGLTLSVRLSDLERGIEIESDRFDSLKPDTLLEMATRVANLAKRGLKIPRTETVDVFAADFATENLSAYEAFIAGMEYFVDYKYRDAEQSFHTALELAPDFSMARYRLAHIQAATGRTDEALESIREATTVEYLPERQRLYIGAAEAWFARDYDAAERAYRELLEHFPYEVEARLHLSHVLLESDHADEAVRELELLTEQEPDNEVVWSLLGETRLLNGRLEEARAALERFAKLAPDSANAHILLGDTHLYQSRLEEARREYEQAQAIDSALAASRIKLALVAVLSGDQDAARAILQTVVDDPEVPPRYQLDAAFNLAYLLQGGGRFEAANALMARMAKPLAAEKVRQALGLTVRGLSRMELGDHDGAASLIDQAIAASPGVPTRYLFARGLLELHRGDIEAAWNTASEIGTHALPESDPDRTEEKAAAYLKGIGFLRRNQIPAALEALQQAVDEEGYRYRIYETGLAEALLESGDSAAAAGLLGRVIEERDPLDPRLDLELDRQRARLLAARIATENGETQTAQRLAQQFLDQLADADDEVRDVETARAIIAGAN
ncbi:MAG TPA: tetratricopeptide repeat protein [Gammaproteobacteria bacterium]|nr:tetratricopeptide repeat protein [Gammaproteobacteria bacterium]